MHILGATGAGKSKLMEGMIIDLLRAGIGVCLVDPNQKIYKDVRARIARHGENYWDKVILIDPTDPDYCVGINPLEKVPGEPTVRKAQYLAEVVAKLFNADMSVTRRMLRIMKHAFWLLMEANLTLVSFERLLVDADFRTRLLLIPELDSKLKRYWEAEFPRAERTRLEWIQSSLNRVDDMVTDPDLQNVFGQQKSTINFKDILDDGKIVLVNIPESEYGKNGYLLGGFIIAMLQWEAMKRGRFENVEHRPFTVFADEFQNYVTDDVEKVITETRKYRFRVVVAHQNMAQIEGHEQLFGAIMNTVGNTVVFQTGREDAEVFVREIFKPPIDQIKHWTRHRIPQSSVWFPMFDEEPVFRSQNEIWEAEARKITSLDKRHYWYKRRGNYESVKLKTPFIEDIPYDDEWTARLVDELRYKAARNYGHTHQWIKRHMLQTIPGYGNTQDFELNIDLPEDEITPFEIVDDYD